MKRRFALILLLLPLTGALRESPAQTSLSTRAMVRFVAVDVMIDPHGKPLACYQLEISATTQNTKLVGIEGGEHPAYEDAPYYDPRALMGRRIILGAFNTGTSLPTSATRVATLMFRVEGHIEPQYQTQLQVAATSDASAIEAAVSLRPQGPIGATNASQGAPR